MHAFYHFLDRLDASNTSNTSNWYGPILVLLTVVIVSSLSFYFGRKD